MSASKTPAPTLTTKTARRAAEATRRYAVEEDELANWPVVAMSGLRSSRDGEPFEAFGERLMPVLADTGIEFSGEPEIFEVQNIVKR